MTVDRAFAVIGDSANREWAYVAMSRGRDQNTVYLSTSAREACNHLGHQTHDDLDDEVIGRLARRGVQRAAVDVDRALA